MKHEDFASLEIEKVLSRVLDYARKQTGARGAHWISTCGIDRARQASEENWESLFPGADIIGTHVVSMPEADPWRLFQLWLPVVALYPRKQKAPYMSHSLSGGSYVIPVEYEGTLLGLMLLENVAIANPVELESKLLPGFRLASRYMAFAYQYLNAKSQSYVDELTGLFNQRYLPLVLEHEIERARRTKLPFTLLFLDIDYFKLVNDGRGHWVGSRLLGEVAQTLKSLVRTCDYAFRYGGDEFVILLSGSNSENSQKAAERIRKSIENQTFTVEGHNLKLTVSIGLAAYPEHAQSAPGLIQLADQAMYYGKRKSRNIVFVAS